MAWSPTGADAPGRAAKRPAPGSDWRFAFENLLLIGHTGGEVPFKVELQAGVEREVVPEWAMGPAVYLALLPNAVEAGALFHARYRFSRGLGLHLSAGPGLVVDTYAHELAAVGRIGVDVHGALGVVAETRIRLYDSSDGRPRFPNTIMLGVVGRGGGAVVMTVVEVLLLGLAFSQAGAH